jgi:putative ABC transport system permease protein
MFKNYLKIALRSLWKSKGFSAINIFGLAIGLATCLLITLYVIDELNYDRYNEKADRIYRINSDIKFGGGDLHLTVTSDPMGAVLKKDYPQVEEYARIYNSQGSKLVKKGSQFITEQNIAHVDSTFFRVFTLPSIAGNTLTALNEPNTVVLTESSSKKYFQTVNSLGKTLEIGKEPYKVTAVIRDMPRNSHFHFDFLLSMDNVEYQWGNFLSNNFQTYIVLQKGVDYKVFEKNFITVIDKYLLPQAKQFMQINSMDDFKKAGNKLEYTLMPLTDIHLHSDRFPELAPTGSIQYVYIFSAVALFVLLIACINFMNLSTARSANRAKEVGIRKVLGTAKGTLVKQFLFESIITVTIALIIALGIAALVLPLFNNVAAKTFSLNDFFTGKILFLLLLLPFVVGTLAGSYPAFFLSRFKPITVLKGSTAGIFKKSNLRSALVVFQFATSIILIVSTVIVYSQLSYIQSKNLGFNKEQVLIVNGTNALGSNIDAFKNEVANLPGVSSASYTGYLPVSASARNDNTFSKTAVMDSKSGVNMQRWTVDYDYIPTLGMQIVQGRNFSKEFGSDSSRTIINETTAKLFGFESPIGQKIYTYNDNNEPVAYQIIGVVKNFHFESLRQNIGPLCMMLGKASFLTSFKVSTANIQTLVKEIEAKWKAMAPGMTFSYRFLDDSFNEMYRNEQRVGKIAITFAVLAILIACLGLFGLVTYAAERRIKEIGIRKVLGATISNIITMLSKDFLLLVVIAAIISFPVAWWVMHKWLQDFAYRINISWWVFIIAGLVAAAIAFITVSFQAVRAAMANPVKNLRTE